MIMAEKVEQERLVMAGREIVVTNPAKLLIPAAKVTKLDLVHFYVGVAEGALRGAGGRP
jgi:DNA primase